MPQTGQALVRLHEHLHQTRLLGSISSALYYDQNTVMPAAGADWRGQQLALLATQLHERQSSERYADLVAAAEADSGIRPRPGARGGICSCCGRSWSGNAASIPSWWPAWPGPSPGAMPSGRRRAATTILRSSQPALEELLQLRREQAAQLAPIEPAGRSPWEILAQPFEPDVSKDRLQELFTPLSAGIPPLLERVLSSSPAAAASPSSPSSSHPGGAPGDPLRRAARELGLRPRPLPALALGPSLLLHPGPSRLPHHHPGGARSTLLRLPGHRP